MKSEDHEHDRGPELRQQFHDLRRHDARLAPGFHDLLRADRRRPFPFFRLAALTTAVAAVVIVSLSLPRVVTQHQTPPQESGVIQWQEASNWEPASDALLNISSTPWTADFDAPTDALLAGATSGANVTQADL